MTIEKRARIKTSPIWFITKKDLQNLLDTSNTICDVLKSFNLSPYNGNHRTLHKRIEQDELNLEKFEENRRAFNIKKHSELSHFNLRSLDDILVENSTYNNGTSLKKRLIKAGILQNKCYGVGCTIVDDWLGNPLSLQLDHENGINNDNRKENLRLLCPNCHSQTKTYSGKKYKIDKQYESNEAKQLRFLKMRKVRERPVVDVLITQIKSRGYEATGRMYGVSGNTIRKWLSASVA
jgi:hypothetical protein